ncbi:MAG: hypothetical protein GY913_05920 [Proteobacteria bacterium]|nr:hypothetical protein [Pseudomonadota bacterium]MCP4916442.1 hypothetical protein [Pseudomonadota bacterium]
MDLRHDHRRWGWTLILDWNRVDDGDTQADFEALFTENENNFADWTAGTTYIQWSDLDATADVLDYEADVDVPNDGETASSVEEILCRTYNNYSSSGWTAWSSAEQAFISYTCSSVSSSSVTYTLDGQNQAALSAEIEVFRVTSLVYDINYGDTSRLYELAFWVR